MSFLFEAFSDTLISVRIYLYHSISNSSSSPIDNATVATTWKCNHKKMSFFSLGVQDQNIKRHNDEFVFFHVYAMRSQKMNAKAIHKKTLCRNLSSSYWGDPTAASGVPISPSPKLKFVAKNPKGKAPIPNDIWNPAGPFPNPQNPGACPLPLDSGSGLCPLGLGGMGLSRGSLGSAFPRPYRGTTLSLPMPALQTGQIWWWGLVSSHWWRHGQQNRCPHIEMTASEATSRQMLHSKAESFLSSSPFFRCSSSLSEIVGFLLLAPVSSDTLESVSHSSPESSIVPSSGSCEVSELDSCSLGTDSEDVKLLAMFRITRQGFC